MRACSSCRGEGNGTAGVEEEAGADEDAETDEDAAGADDAGADICTQTHKGRERERIVRNRDRTDMLRASDCV